ncbi:unnamed protein product [Durusdinium trenchii]|uniref:Uncharacterized protein n=1 Tax=Durusdinium trenchii TaxID=1381693 RepID=A0ABP0IC31_9DINO
MSVLPENGHIDLGSIWYLKGAGSVQTAMAVVLAFHKLGKEVPQVLKNSLQRIKCKHIRLKDQKTELFFNMKRSAKNSIRNEEAPRHDRIVGLKQTAVKVLLELPDTARNCILQTVSFYGWESSLGAKFLGRLRSGDLTLQMELSSACAARDESILEILNELTPGKVVADGKAEAALHKSAAELDSAGYQLLMEEIAYDERCLQVFQGKVSNFEIRVTQLKDSWRQKRFEHAMGATQKWLDSNVESFAWPSKFDSGSALTMMKRLEDALLFICNYAAPSLIKSDVTAGTFSMIGHMLGSQTFGANSCGLMLCPVFSYQKHKLFVEDWLWRDSSLCKLRRNVAEAKQLAGKHMIQVEDMSPTALPATTDNPIQGAHKYAQVGPDAAKKLLQSAVEGVAFGNQLALMLVDCTPLVGNFFEGFIDLANDLNVPLKYAPIFADDSAEEWFFSYFQQELVRRFQLNDFKIRNVDRLAEEPPPAHMESKPEPPLLKRCVWGKVNGEISTIEIPEAEVKKWWGKDEWRVFVQDFQDRHPTVKKLEKATPKSSGTTPSTTPVPRKRSLEVDYSQCVVVEDDAPGSVTIANGSVLAGWGKGKFRERGQKPCDENELEFLCTSETMVHIDNKCLSLSDLLDSEKESAKVAYYKVSKDPDGKWNFKQDGSGVGCVVERKGCVC